MNQQKEWVQVQSELLAQVSVLRSEISAAQLERTKLEGELNMHKEQNQQLDLNNVRLNSQYQVEQNNTHHRCQMSTDGEHPCTFSCLNIQQELFVYVLFLINSSDSCEEEQR